MDETAVNGPLVSEFPFNAADGAFLLIFLCFCFFLNPTQSHINVGYNSVLILFAGFFFFGNAGANEIGKV